MRETETISHRARGRLINMSNCRNIWIHGLKLGYAASWNLHFIYYDNIVTDHCVIESKGVWNGDGWDPDSSTNSTIYACEFYTEDDSVAVKSGKNPEGNEISRPSEHIRVFDCTFERLHLLGRFLDNNAGKNDWHDCPSILLCGFDRPGFEVKNILFKDIEMENPAAGTDSIHMEYCDNIRFENIKSRARNGIPTVNRK